MIVIVPAGLTINEKIPLILKGMRPSKWSNNDLALALGVDRADVENWIYKGTRKVREYGPAISRATGVNLAWLMDDERGKPIVWDREPGAMRFDEVLMIREPRAEYAPNSLGRGDTVQLALWRGVAASANDECYFIEPDSPEFIEIPAFFVPGNNPHGYVVCVAAGTSMSPRIRQGFRIVVRLNPNPSVSSLIIAESSEDRHRVIKVLREIQGRFELHSLNPDHRPITRIDGWRFIGEVTGILGDYETGQPNIEWNFGRPLRG